ncbi:MAG: hypothetical protein R3B45_10815 [Bdellovibrionota bacterium]
MLQAWLKKIGFVPNVYFWQMLLGVINLLCIVVLENNLPRSEFSRISLILGFYPTYFLLVEMGIQGELVRRFSKFSIDSQWNSAFRLRLFGGGLGVLAVVFNTYIGGGNISTVIAAGLFSLSFLPAAGLITIEALGYAKRSLVDAIMHRAGRVVSILLVTFLLLSWKNFSFEQSWGIYLLGFYFPILMIIYIWVKRYTLPFKDKSNLRHSNVRQLFEETHNLLLARGLAWLYTVGFLTFNMKLHTDTGMSEYNVAYNLIAPVSMLVQVLSQNRISVMAHGRKEEGNTALRYLFVLFGLFSYFTLFSFQGVVDLFFSKINSAKLAAFLWPFGLAAMLFAVSSVLQVEAQARGRRNLIYFTPLASLVVLIFSFGLFPKFIPIMYSGWINLVAACASLLVLVIGLLNSRKTIP